MKKTSLILSLLGFLLINPLFSQHYFNTIGFRYGNSDNLRMVGITYQQRVLKKLTIEGIVQTDFSHNTTLHVLGEGHYNIISRRLNLYYGGGFSWGWEQSQVEDPETQTLSTTYGNKTRGIDLVAGLELTLARINISLDYKPNVNLVGRDPWLTNQMGISVRYVLITQSSINKGKRQRARKKRKKARAKNRSSNQGGVNINWPWNKK